MLDNPKVSFMGGATLYIRGNKLPDSIDKARIILNSKMVLEGESLPNFQPSRWTSRPATPT